jgi:predicted PurR-regulated permease PerM
VDSPAAVDAAATDGEGTDETSTASPPSSPVRSMTPFLLRGVSSVVSLLSWLFFIPLISLFFLLEKRALSERLAKAIGNYDRYERICSEMREMSHGFFLGNFVVWGFMTAAFFGVFVALRLEAPFQLALFAGFLNLVPVFGAILGAILPGAQAFLQFDGLGALMVVALANLVIHFVGNNIVMPKFLGNRVNLNASAAMVGFLFWGAVWGAPGLFLAIPLMASIRICLEASPRWSDFADLLSETPTSTLARLSLTGVFRKADRGGPSDS